MEQADLLRRLIEVLEELQIRYMVVGSMASAAYGEPRMTQDVDVVVDLDREQGLKLCRAFGDESFYVSESAMSEAIRTRGQFNVIHSQSGNKIDIMIVPAGAWGEAELSRRQQVRILPDLEGYCARPEDVILGKMSYYAEGGSEKHLRDIAGMMRVSRETIDQQYIEKWASSLGLQEVWQALKRKTGF